MKNRNIALLLAAGMLLGLLTGCGSETASAVSAPSAEVTEASEATETPLEPGSAEESDAPKADQVASAGEMTTVEEVVEEGMTPVSPSELKDGTYEVEMKSSSSMFKGWIAAELRAGEWNRWQAVLYMTSQSYLYLYAGTAEEAAAASEEDYIPREDAGDGMGSYTLPVEALDTGISCAAFSKKKEKWYDRTLLFRADSLPQDAFLEARGTSAADLLLDDGEYTVDVTLAGGSGRASVESPGKAHGQRRGVHRDHCMEQLQL